MFAAAPTLIKLQPDLAAQLRNKDAHTASVPSPIPAHLVEEAVGFGHAVQLVFVLLQQVDVALLRDKLQQLPRGGEKRCAQHGLGKLAHGTNVQPGGGSSGCRAATSASFLKSFRNIADG